MTLSCSICHKQFTSLDLRTEIALKELSESLVGHLQKDHKSEATHLIQTHMQMVGILMWFLLMTYYAEWTTEEANISKEYNQWSEKIAKSLKFNVVEKDSGPVVKVN